MSPECRNGDCDLCNDPECRHGVCHGDPAEDTTAYWPEEEYR